MKINLAPMETAKDFCSCPVEKCPRHPRNHENGCTPCIRDNLRKGKIPACFFRAIRNETDGLTDFSVEGFVGYFLKYGKKSDGQS